jgi:vacuolar-type H+-ATPase subunit H
MQKTVLSEIIKSEKEAEAVIQDARKKAAEIVSKADAEYNSSISGAREKNQKKIQEEISEAHKRASESFAEAVKDAEKENSDFFAESKERTDSVAKDIAESLLKPEFEK